MEQAKPEAAAKTITPDAAKETAAAKPDEAAAPEQKSILKQFDPNNAKILSKEDPSANQPNPKEKQQQKLTNIVDPQKNIRINETAVNIRQRSRELYKSIEQLDEKIEEYFTSGGTIREVIVGNGANKRVLKMKVHTIVGLTLYLGYVNRTSLLEMERDPIFGQSIKRAISKIEQIYEENLQTTGNSGNIFALKNFGWVDKQEVTHELKTLKLDV